VIAANVVDSTFNTSSLVDGILARYRLEEPVSSRFWSRGVNDTYQVTSGAGYMLRIYRNGWRTHPQVDWELSVLQQLSASGLDVSTPVAAIDGTLVQVIDAPEGPRPAALFTLAPGDLPPFTADGATAYGRAAARLHAGLDELGPVAGNRDPIDLHHLLDDPLAILSTCIDDPELSSELERTADLARAGIEARAGDLEWGACHGDLHGGNAHRSNEGTVTFFDFDCGGPGWRSYDLAVYRWSSTAMRAPAGTDDRWDDFLAAYTATRPLAEIDIATVPFFVAARHIWLMGLHARLLPVIGGLYLAPAALGRHRTVLQHWREHHLEP
jgi:Ser/Thr protein kinase RdoA (MazF antagonist)